MSFKELAKRWKPILDVYEDNGVDLCYEAHASEDIHDGASWEMFLDAVNGTQDVIYFMTQVTSFYNN